ncbi:O-antigen ligase family protein [Sedimentibacter sp.]|uniref:O-antigen ligase family protein n=1 Tax=Sedimentibacter sp. TaxID=1960295 RepID=UPI0028AFE78D|nr:O-antigen ligase family protein [Sedimentibacter sp.]
MNSNCEISKARIKGDIKLSIALMSTFVVLILQYFILVFFDIIDTDIGNKVQIISKLIVGIIFIYALPVALKRNNLKLILTYVAAALVFLINYLNFTENREYIEILIFPFFFTCLPSFIFCYSIYNLNVFGRIMKKSSNVMTVFGIIIAVMVFLGKASVGSYSMTLSYYILIPAVIYLDQLMDKFTLKYFFSFLILVIIILTLGARGPILCAIIFIVLKFFKKKKILNRKNIFQYTLIVALITILLINYRNILISLNGFLIEKGINSRSIHLFLESGVHLSGRENIYYSILSAIYTNPILGLGLAGDRVITGSYSHNIFLELLLDFGVFVGLILIFILFLLIIRALMIKDNEKYDMIIIWFSLGFVHLFISSSYLVDIKFWIFLGLILNIITKSKLIGIKEQDEKKNNI